MTFIDEARIWVRGGKGGAGACHFRRERFIPKGGPDGGDGGRGGHVILKGDGHLTTLLAFRYRKRFRASDGAAGRGDQAHGANGKDLLFSVPLGTVITDESRGVVGDITMHDQHLVVAHGGRGGLGNRHFKSATNRAPRFAQPGEGGEEFSLLLTLKTIADIGIVGMPNAGKSTLLAAISAARPRIGHYPFTTLVPNLGRVTYQKDTFSVADIPGLIEGASLGKGLGIRFLRHIERTKALLFAISTEEEDIEAAYKLLRKELYAYDPLLLDKPHLLVITKVDLWDREHYLQAKEKLEARFSSLFVSALEERGLGLLKERLWELLH